MARHNTLYYLLFVALVMGAFAAMAQNGYGITILGAVSFSFSLLFFIELVPYVGKDTRANFLPVVELSSLGVISFLLGLRVFYIHFAMVELLFGAFAALLIIVYAIRLRSALKALIGETKTMKGIVVLYFTSTLVYIFSMLSVPLFPALTEPAGVLAFILLIAFVLVSYFNKAVIVKGERISGFSLVFGFPDRSVVLMMLFLIFSLYMGFTKIKFLPTMYSNEFPSAYYDLLEQATTGVEKPVNGVFKHDEFKKKYDAFVKRNVR